MKRSKFVSRAGEKLKYALDEFGVSANEMVCADFGSSTGGFVGVLLDSGAKKVYSVDTSYGELDWNLRNNPKVIVMERTNAMHIKLPEKVDLITIDVGWTKQEKILPNAFANLKDSGIIISLIKPHYEADKKFIRKGKLMDEKRDEVMELIKKDFDKIIQSPILGGRAKNIEFLGLIMN